MPKEQLFIDSSVIIRAFLQEDETTNSALVLKLILEKKISGIISRKVVEEVKRFFSLKRGEKFAYSVEIILKKKFLIVEKTEIEKELIELSGKIKDKDLEHLATAKKYGARILAFDRDFQPFEEYITPKKFLEKLGYRTRETEF